MIPDSRHTSPRVMFLSVAKIAIVPVRFWSSEGHNPLTVALFLDCGRPHLGLAEGEPQ